MSKLVTGHIRKTQVGFSVLSNSHNHLAPVFILPCLIITVICSSIAKHANARVGWTNLLQYTLKKIVPNAQKTPTFAKTRKGVR